MKFVFVVNPAAGKGGWKDKLCGEIKKAFLKSGHSFEIYLTKGPGDAVSFVRAYPGEQSPCFVACGGDGTLSEVAQGLAGRVRPLFSVIPMGSGNDFARAFGSLSPFRSPEALLSGTPRPVDLIDCGGHVSLNLCNLGFDADVVKNAVPFKKLRFLPGPAAYALSVARTLAGKISRPLTITLDGTDSLAMDSLLCVLANGRYCGGGFACAPKSVLDDGLMDVVAVEKVSRLTFAKLVGYYRRGEHLDRPEFREMVHYRRAREVKVEAERDFTVCVDGEVLRTCTFSARVLPSAAEFWAPAGTGGSHLFSASLKERAYA